MNIGLIGCGRWGKFILRDLLDIGCEVTVVARSSRTVEQAHAGGATNVVRSIVELVN